MLRHGNKLRANHNCHNPKGSLSARDRAALQSSKVVQASAQIGKVECNHDPEDPSWVPLLFGLDLSRAPDDLVGPNPSLRPNPPSTPEATLPPLSPAPPVESATSAMEMETESNAPETPRATKKLRLRSLQIQAVQFGDHSYEVNDEGSHDFDCDDVWEAETNLWSGASEASRGDDDEWKASPDEEVTAESDERLWFPDNGREPELDSATLAELDALADEVEIRRPGKWPYAGFLRLHDTCTS